MLTLYRSPECEGDAEERGETAEAVGERFGRELTYISPNEIRLLRRARGDESEESLLPLVESIRLSGILHPFVICPTAKGKPLLVFGERRLLAARRLGLPTVPCVTLSAKEGELAELRLAAALAERPLTAFEEAESIAAALSESGISRTALARRLSLSPLSLSEKLRSATVSETLRRSFLEAELSERHLAALLRLPGERDRETVLSYLASRGLSAEATEMLVERLISGGEAEEKRERRRIKGALGDLRLLLNSIERAAETARRAGLSVTVEKSEDGEEIGILLRILPESCFSS